MVVVLLLFDTDRHRPDTKKTRKIQFSWSLSKIQDFFRRRHVHFCLSLSDFISTETFLARTVHTFFLNCDAALCCNNLSQRAEIFFCFTKFVDAGRMSSRFSPKLLTIQICIRTSSMKPSPHAPPSSDHNRDGEEEYLLRFGPIIAVL